MTSAFQIYGNTTEVHSYLRSQFSGRPEYLQMIDVISPEWRNAIVYVLARSNRLIYISEIYRAYISGVLEKIDPEFVKAGTDAFMQTVNQHVCQ